MPKTTKRKTAIPKHKNLSEKYHAPKKKPAKKKKWKHVKDGWNDA